MIKKSSLTWIPKNPKENSKVCLLDDPTIQIYEQIPAHVGWSARWLSQPSEVQTGEPHVVLTRKMLTFFAESGEFW